MNGLKAVIMLLMVSILALLIICCGPPTETEKDEDEVAEEEEEETLEFTVPTVAMEDTLHMGDILIVDPRIGKIERGDIVIFRFLGDSETYHMDEDDLLVKRIIGMPLEEVRILNHRVYIDGVPVEELGLDEDSYTLHWRHADRERAEAINAPCIDYDPGSDLWARIELVFRVPEGCYFVMGDHRDVSVDSRSIPTWAVPRENIVGVYKPPTETENGEDEGVRAEASDEVVVTGKSEREAKEAQLKAADSLDIPVEITNSIGMKLRLTPAGSFLMGSDSHQAGDDEKPVHRVEITKPYYIGVYEVTQAQYEETMGTNPSEFTGSRRPVEQVSWNDAQEFCRRLTQREGVTYRLPTEAEWEYAARAGTTTEYYWGNSMDGRYAWYDDNSGRETHEVGRKLPNSWGLYDMSGNVWEWCSDWYSSYSSSSQTDPKGAQSGKYRVLRGGSWLNLASYIRSAFRDGYAPDLRNGLNGFRCVREVE